MADVLKLLGDFAAQHKTKSGQPYNPFLPNIPGVASALPPIIPLTSNVRNAKPKPILPYVPAKLPPIKPVQTLQQPSFATGGNVQTAGAAPTGIEALITKAALSRGLDPKAVLAVAAAEGLSGRIGDNNSSFGPFQLHYGGMYPSSAPQGNPQASQAWAMSPAGINYALNGIQRVAKGLTGRAAVSAIVNKFERPADPAAEISRAWATYLSNPDAQRNELQSGQMSWTPPAQGTIRSTVQDHMDRPIGNWESDNAVDVEMPIGTPVRATTDGVIGTQFGPLNSSDPKMAGLRLHLIGGGNEWYYAHLSKFAPGIKPGTRVKAGQIIGYSGRANGLNHLHLGQREGDPATIWSQ